MSRAITLCLEMPEPTPLDLTPNQIAVLQRLLNAGFHFASLEHVTRHVAVDRDGFVALLEPADDKLKIFGQVGYRIGDGIGMLVEQREGKAFIWKGRTVEATPELLAAYARVKAELRALLE